MQPHRIAEISEAARDRYAQRLARHGPGVQALGWGTPEHQRMRFKAAVSLMQGSSVLDLGCGFGDFFAYLRDTGKRPPAYCGVDILPEFIAEATCQHGAEPGVRFLKTDVFDVAALPSMDSVVALGLLNYRLGSEAENYAYIATFVGVAFSLAKQCLVFDGISRYRTPEYPEEQFIFYADPTRVLEIASRFTSDFVLVHDIPPIPQREYLICLRKQN